MVRLGSVPVCAMVVSALLWMESPELGEKKQPSLTALPQLGPSRPQEVTPSGLSEESPSSPTPEASDNSLPHLPGGDPAEPRECLQLNRQPVSVRGILELRAETGFLGFVARPQLVELRR